MFPTMSMTGEAALELKWIDPKRLRRGDLVTYISPIDPTRRVCKRVTGLPGDIICVDPTGEYAPSTEHVVVPRNHIWVTGDNLAWSRDSRMYGPVPLGLVKGRLYARVRLSSALWRIPPSLRHRSGLCEMRQSSGIHSISSTDKDILYVGLLLLHTG